MENGVGRFAAELYTWGCQSSANWRKDDNDEFASSAAVAAAALVVTVDGMSVFEEVLMDTAGRGTPPVDVSMDVSIDDVMDGSCREDDEMEWLSISLLTLVAEVGDKCSEYTASVISLSLITNCQFVKVSETF